MKDKDRVTPAAKWLRIGPGVVIAAVLSVVVWGQWTKIETVLNTPNQQHPMIEQHLVSSSTETDAGPIPELEFILDRSDSLKLNRSQREQIMKLQQDWLHRYAPKMAAAQQAADTTREYLQQKQQSSRVPVEQIQNNAAPLISLSAEISTARRYYWNHAIKLLTIAQRDMLNKARIADWQARQKRMLDLSRPK
ncbi:MAG: hypothetical protein ACYC1M_02435 [Armatimonadota bacterium]